jgi:hypothetical protein
MLTRAGLACPTVGSTLTATASVVDILLRRMAAAAIERDIGLATGATLAIVLT